MPEVAAVAHKRSRRLNQVLRPVAVLAVLCLAVTLRWYRLAQSVLEGFDVWTYLRLSWEWATVAVQPEAAYAKAGFVLLGAAAGGVFGFSDLTLPFLNASLDVLNAVLVLVLARLIGIGFTSACVAMLLYACLPTAVIEARNGLAHPASITFVLSACALLLVRTSLPISRITERYAAVVGAGLLAGYGGLIHPTVLLWTLALPLILVLYHATCLKSPAWLIEDLLLYVLACTAPFCGFALLVKKESAFWYKAQSFWHSIFGHGDDPAYMKAGFTFSLEKLRHYSVDMVYAHVLTPALFWTFLTLALLAAWTGLRLHREGLSWSAAVKMLFPTPLPLFSLALICICIYLSLIARINGFEQWFMGDRFFLPLAPFAILGGAALLQAACQGLPRGGRTLLVGLTCTVALTSFWSLFPQYLYDRPPFYKALRDTFRKQGIVTDTNHKVLVVPDAGKHPMAVDYYFSPSDFVTTGIPQNEETFTAFLAENHIRYILFSPVVYLRLTSREGQPAVMASEDPKVMAELTEQVAFVTRFLMTRHGVPRLCQELAWPKDMYLRPMRLYAIGNHDYSAHLGSQNGRDNAFCLFDLGTRQ